MNYKFIARLCLLVKDLRGTSLHRVAVQLLCFPEIETSPPHFPTNTNFTDPVARSGNEIVLLHDLSVNG